MSGGEDRCPGLSRMGLWALRRKGPAGTHHIGLPKGSVGQRRPASLRTGEAERQLGKCQACLGLIATLAPGGGGSAQGAPSHFPPTPGTQTTPGCSYLGLLFSCCS